MLSPIQHPSPSAKINGTQAKHSEKCVIKHCKEKTVFQPTGWETTMRMHEEANKLTEEFNKFHRTHQAVSFKGTANAPITNINGPQMERILPC